MSIIGTVYEDVTSDVVGSIGAWQWLVVFACTTLMIPSIFIQYEDMFLLHPVGDIICIAPTDHHVTNTTLCFVKMTNNSTSHFKCENWYIRLMWIVWIKKSWMIFCDNKLKLVSTAMVSRVGQMFGCVIFGVISDRIQMLTNDTKISCGSDGRNVLQDMEFFGRKVAIVTNVFADISLGLLLTFCDSEGWYQLIVFLTSLFGCAHKYLGLLLTCEIASNQWRSWLNTIVMLPRLFALVCMVPLANSTANQPTLNFVAALYGALLIVTLRWIPESPQWLLYNRKINKAEKILLKAAMKNGIYLCSDFKIRPVNQRAYTCLDEPRSCLGLLTSYNIRMTIVISLMFWVLYYFQWSYLYVKLYSEENDQLLLKIFCFAILFGGLAVLLSKKLILRHILLISVFITGIFIAGDAFLSKEGTENLLSSVALASCVIGHALLLNISPRLFAITVRGTLLGACQAIGQLGSIVGYITFLFYPMSSLTIMGATIGITLTLSALCLMFLDVDGRELPDVMEDMDYFSELSKPLRWATQKTNSPSHEEVEIRIHSFNNTVSTIDSADRLPPARHIGFGRIRPTFRKYFSNLIKQ